MLVKNVSSSEFVKMNGAYCIGQNRVSIYASADHSVDAYCIDIESARKFVGILFEMDAAGVTGLDLAKVHVNGHINLDSEILREFDPSRPRELSAE